LLDNTSSATVERGIRMMAEETMRYSNTICYTEHSNRAEQFMVKMEIYRKKY
jgi:hypothetical protein